MDPHSILAWIQDPDPYSESGSGSRCLKIGLKSQKTLEGREQKNAPIDFNHSFFSLFQELITLGNFLLSRTVEKLSHRMEINIFNIYDSALFENIFENNLLLFSLVS